MIKTREQVMGEQRDIEYLSNPHMWLQMVVPMKRYRGHVMAVGVYTSDGMFSEGATIFGGPDQEFNWVAIAPEQLVTSGWRVD